MITNSIQNLVKPFLTINSIFQQSVRTTYVLERRYPLPLNSVNRKPKKLKHKHFIYKLVEDVNTRKRPLLDVILLQAVEGIGEAGERIQVKEWLGYNQLLLPKRAVYASPENIEKYKYLLKEERTYSSLIAPQTARKLSTVRLGVGMSAKNPWTIENWHIRVNLRLIGITATDESITLPDKPISGPNLELEGKEFYVTITINKKEQAKVRCVIYHHFLPNQSPFPENYWQYPGEAVYPEFQEILDSMPKDYPLMNEPKPDMQTKRTLY